MGFILFLLALMVTAWGFSLSPFLGFVFLIALFVYGYNKEKLRKRKKEKEITDRWTNLGNVEEKLSNFSFSQKYVSTDLNSSIMIDEEAKKICIVQNEMKNEKVYDFKDILESEIIEDGTTINKTSRSSQIGGAILGGILAGGTGAIIGGLSGQTSTEEEVVRMDLKIIVNDTKQPIHLLNFLIYENNGPKKNNAEGIKKSDPLYKSAFKEASHWHSLISVLIKQADKQDKEMNVQPSSTQSSVADEIKKLASLYKDGILTVDEYNQLKGKLLK